MAQSFCHSIAQCWDVHHKKIDIANNMSNNYAFLVSSKKIIRVALFFFLLTRSYMYISWAIFCISTDYIAP
jgi:hypothetical protein